MKTSSQLLQELKSIDRRSYPAYKSLKGAYQFDDYVLFIDHVQGDPFAAPSSVSVCVPAESAAFPAEYYEKRYTKRALEDALLRRFSSELSKISFRAKGSGKSGLISTSRPGPEILERSAMRISNGNVCARFEVGFPANGRTVNASELEKIFFELIPPAVRAALFYGSYRKETLFAVYELAIDQHFIREELSRLDLAAFCANGSILPRESGVSTRPMKNAVPLISPESMEITLDLPCKGRVSGMGIKRGVTLIIGGGYHGKSTLLQALEQGVYDHVGGDGREYVITEESAMKIRAEDGRSVKNLDLSLFIHDLPNGKDTACFSTEDASGSTSQASAVMEGIEAGCRTFLIDEDTSATNFLLRDAFMQQVVCREKEPITPFFARIRDLYEKAGISTVLVAGSSGAFFHVADSVIQMDAYRPFDVKERADRLLTEHPVPDFDKEAFALPEKERLFWGKPAAESAPGRGHYRGSNRGGAALGRFDREDRIKVKVMGKDGFSINHKTVDLRYAEQLADSEQTAALAGVLRYIMREGAGRVSVRALVNQMESLLSAKGLDPFIEGAVRCGFARPRKQEIFFMLNRYRG